MTNCNQCGIALSPESKYCGQCGTLADLSLEYNDPFRSNRLIWVFVYYGLALVSNLIFGFSDVFSLTTDMVVIDSIFVVLTLVAASQNMNELKPLLSLRGLKPLIILAAILGAVLLSILVNLTIPYINEWLFHTDNNYYYLYSGTAYPVLFMFLSMAVLPAFFEELAFRGFVFNNLKSFTNSQAAMIISALLFSILHLSFISFFWLLPFALIAGYLRIRFNTLWYGIIAHFVFNSVTCLFSMYEAGVLVVPK